MMIEVGDFTDLGEAWVRYQGSRHVADYSELLRRGSQVDPHGALAPERHPELIQYYELSEAELDGSYTCGGCWVFRVTPAPSLLLDNSE